MREMYPDYRFATLNEANNRRTNQDPSDANDTIESDSNDEANGSSRYQTDATIAISDSDLGDNSVDSSTIPKKKQRISESLGSDGETVQYQEIVSNLSILPSTLNDSNVLLNQRNSNLNYVAPAGESIAQLEAPPNEQTIQTLRDELKSMQQSHANDTKLLSKLKAEHAAQLDKTREATSKIKQLKKIRTDLRQGIDAGHTAMVELQKKMETNHKKELDELRAKYEKQLAELGRKVHMVTEGKEKSKRKRGPHANNRE